MAKLVMRPVTQQIPQETRMQMPAPPADVNMQLVNALSEVVGVLQKFADVGWVDHDGILKKNQELLRGIRTR